MELIKYTAMITIMELIRSKSEDEVYNYLLKVEKFLTFFREEKNYLNVDNAEYKSTGNIKYITDNVFLDIASEVDKINRLTTVFWGDIKDKYLITFHPFYQDCEEIATDILKQIKIIMKPLKEDFEELMTREDVLCVKTVVNIDFATQFAANRIYSVTSVNLETRGKYDDDKRIVYLELRHGDDRCKFVEQGKNAEQIIFDKLKSCFVPMSKVISVYRENMARNLLNK
jgi:hypothetical protein